MAVESIEPASSDASFRRYFRVLTEGRSLIVMDAPPAKEDIRPFIGVGDLFAAAGINVPNILERDEKQGFLLLSDMGSVSYLQGLNSETVSPLYQDAIRVINRLQLNVDTRLTGLPIYNEALLSRELSLFNEWFLKGRLRMFISDKDATILQKLSNILIESALEQPRACVHRDYHSRNLMIVESGNPGVLDFQDAVVGPFSYDLVSLLKDCYISWPEIMLDAWVFEYHKAFCSKSISLEQFTKWFDWMGLQRHLKAIGIFSRLHIRDAKADYLSDIPRTMNYVSCVAKKYSELHEFDEFLHTEIIGRIGEVTSE